MYSYLVADALYYHLPKLMLVLAQSEIFVRIGTTQFRIPRDIFSNPGDSPNFFTIGFSIFFNDKPDMTFPKKMIRPLPLAPAAVANRSAELFSEILSGLSGNFIEIKSEAHRQGLLKEARYYRLRGLEQKLIKHSITKNLARGIEEIVLELPDIKPAGIEIVQGEHHGDKFVGYKRPFVDNYNRELIFQINAEELRLMRSDISGYHLTCTGSSAQNLEMIASTVRMQLTIHDIRANLTEMPYDVTIENASMIIDGVEYVDPIYSLLSSSSAASLTSATSESVQSEGNLETPPSKRRKASTTTVFYLTKSQWRFSTKAGEPCLSLLKCIGYTKPLYKNASREFL